MIVKKKEPIDIKILSQFILSVFNMMEEINFI